MACIITSLKCHSTCHLVSRRSVSRTGQQRLRDINTDISPKSHSWKNFHFRSVWIQSPLAFPVCFVAKQRWKWTELGKKRFPSKARAAALVRRDLCSGTGSAGHGNPSVRDAVDTTAAVEEQDLFCGPTTRHWGGTLQSTHSRFSP